MERPMYTQRHYCNDDTVTQTLWSRCYTTSRMHQGRPSSTTLSLLPERRSSFLRNTINIGEVILQRAPKHLSARPACPGHIYAYSMYVCVILLQIVAFRHAYGIRSIIVAASLDSLAQKNQYSVRHQARCNDGQERPKAKGSHGSDAGAPGIA